MDPQPIPYATPTRRGAPAVPSPSPEVLTSATVGWRTAAAAAWLAGVLGAAGYAVATFYDQQQGTGLTSLVGAGPAVAAWVCTLGPPAAFAVAVGAVAAAVLYHWTAGRLAWVAAGPAVAGVGSALVVAQSSAAGPPALLGLAAVIAGQAAGVYAGTWVGRPLARWLARRLVPPPLRASLVAVWV